MFWHIYLLEKHQKENVQSTRINLDREINEKPPKIPLNLYFNSILKDRAY